MKNEENKEDKKYETILLERIEKNIGLLAEGQSALRGKVDELAEDVKIVKQDAKLLKEDMDYVKSNLVDKSERFKEIDKVADDHEKRLVKLENPALAKA